MSSLNPQIDKVFIIHTRADAQGRRAFVEKGMRDFSIPFTFMLDWDVEDITEDTLNNWRVLREMMPLPSTSCALKHIAVHQEIVDKGYGLTLVFEDDVILNPEFHTMVDKALEELKTVRRPAIVSIGASMNLYTPRSRMVPGKFLYEANMNRATDSYIVTQEAATNRLQWIKDSGIILPADHLMDHADRETGNVIFWLEPPVVEPGSHTGVFSSQLDSKGTFPHIFRKLRWLWQKMRKKYLYQLFR